MVGACIADAARIVQSFASGQLTSLTDSIENLCKIDAESSLEEECGLLIPVVAQLPQNMQNPFQKFCERVSQSKLLFLNIKGNSISIPKAECLDYVLNILKKISKEKFNTRPAAPRAKRRPAATPAPALAS